MEETGGGSAAAAASVNQWWQELSKIFRYYLDKSTPHATYRWIGTLILASIYALRIFHVQGFYEVTYGLGLYLLDPLIWFLSPLDDPEGEPSDGPMLPIKASDEFEPFVRGLPEFQFWYTVTKYFCIAFVVTFFSIFDTPTSWPALLFCWIVLFTYTMTCQIAHMVKYKYLPFNLGKQKYGGKKSSEVAGAHAQNESLCNKTNFLNR